jgi:hypothetical protein
MQNVWKGPVKTGPFALLDAFVLANPTDRRSTPKSVIRLS